VHAPRPEIRPRPTTNEPTTPRLPVPSDEEFEVVEDSIDTNVDDPVPTPAVKPKPKRHVLKTSYDTVDSEHEISKGRVTPRERFEPETAWSFDDLGSACTVEGFDASNRLDPYWGEVWDTGSSSNWVSATQARKQVALGLGRLPKALAVDSDLATQRVLSAQNWNSRLALMGSLFSFRTMTSEQAAAFTGDKNLAYPTKASGAAMFASGLVDLGTFKNGVVNTTLRGRQAIYRPAQSNIFDNSIKDELTWAEWLSVTGGQKWVAPTGFDRHNILGTELALRLAEYTDIGTVLGERFATVDQLAGSGIGYAPMVGDQKAADLAAVRDDGMMVAIEMTASTSTYFNDKVARWAKLLSERPFTSSGLMVIFVIIEHPDRIDSVRADTYQAIAAACREYPGSVRDRVAERIGVATWREWFPGPGLVHDAFLTMRVDRPTGRSERLWEPCDLLDSTEGKTAAGAWGRPFVAHDPTAMTAVLDNASMLGQTPYWIRERRTPPPVWRRLMDGKTLPNPTPYEPERAKGRRPGQGVGAVGNAKPPARILGLKR
jgi:hypothetical protein